NANTWIVVQTNGKATPGALADLAVGAAVQVSGVATGTDRVDARVVTAVKPGAAAKPAAGSKPIRGLPTRRAALPTLAQATVQSVANGVITLQAGKNGRDKASAINTDAGTIVIKGGFATVGDLKAGDIVRVLVRAQKPAAGAPKPATRPAPIAQFVYVASANDQAGVVRVKSVDGNTLTVRGLGGEHKITLGAGTTVKSITAAGQPPRGASQADIKAGSVLVVYGPKATNGQPASAALVLILPAGVKK
ncbi:MAG TPA: hypothetical protein VM536_04080, partial [Chloroflexia bacterium]|nr:hypothetical protein [Chloroflexia bacterium]